MLIRPQIIAAVLDALEQRDLIRRVGPRTRGRRNPIELTSNGHAMLELVWGTVEKTNDLTDLGLSPGESAQLNSLLLKLLR